MIYLNPFGLMSLLVRNIIGFNVKSIRKSLGLSQLNFSIITGLSKATLINIESGKTGYNLNMLDNILRFTLTSLDDLVKKDFKPTINFRENLINHYRNSNDKFQILSEKPELTFAIKSKLLKSSFIKSPKEISEIKTYFISFGWEYKGTSISNALKRMPDIIRITPHPSKKNTNLYSLKKQ